MSDDDTAVEDLHNLGPKTAVMLSALGVTCRADIERWGSVGIFLRLRSDGARPSLNLLYALEGALLDRDWRDFTPEEKLVLRGALED